MQEIVEESVPLIPHRFLVWPDAIHGVSDPGKVLKETEGHFFVHRVVFRESHSDFQHAQTIEGHPGCAVSLIEISAGRQRCTAVENADVVEPEESARENVAAF